MSEPVKHRCWKCAEMNLVPVPSQPLDELKVSAIRRDAVEQFLNLLTTQARESERIGDRVKTYQFIFERDRSVRPPKMLTLAQELGASLPSVSRNIANYERELAQIFVNKRKPNERPE